MREQYPLSRAILEMRKNGFIHEKQAAFQNACDLETHRCSLLLPSQLQLWSFIRGVEKGGHVKCLSIYCCLTFLV